MNWEVIENKIINIEGNKFTKKSNLVSFHGENYTLASIEEREGHIPFTPEININYTLFSKDINQISEKKVINSVFVGVNEKNKVLFLGEKSKLLNKQTNLISQCFFNPMNQNLQGYIINHGISNESTFRHLNTEFQILKKQFPKLNDGLEFTLNEISKSNLTCLMTEKGTKIKHLHNSIFHSEYI